jgi:hypothetical protein
MPLTVIIASDVERRSVAVRLQSVAEGHTAATRAVMLHGMKETGQSKLKYVIASRAAFRFAALTLRRALESFVRGNALKGHARQNRLFVVSVSLFTSCRKLTSAEKSALLLNQKDAKCCPAIRRACGVEKCFMLP